MDGGYIFRYGTIGVLLRSTCVLRVGDTSRLRGLCVGRAGQQCHDFAWIGSRLRAHLGVITTGFLECAAAAVVSGQCLLDVTVM